MKNVTLKAGTVKASIGKASIGKTQLERLKEKWDKQKPLKVLEPKQNGQKKRF